MNLTLLSTFYILQLDLIKNETTYLQKKYDIAAGREKIISLFATADIWEIFRFYATSLVMGHQKKVIAKFIVACPSQYDPVADRFVPGIGVDSD